MKINYVISIDGDGNFNATPINQREKVFNDIKSIHYGDYLANMIDDFPIDFFKDLSIFKDDEWLKIITQFEQRGTLQIIEIEN